MVERGANQLVALTARGWGAFLIKKLYLILNIVRKPQHFFCCGFCL